MGLSAAVLLGIIQGLTEFLPVSSSGHLVVAQHFVVGFSQPGVLFDMVLHLGTLLAVLAYFRSDIVRLAAGLTPGRSGASARRLLLLLVVGTLPAAVVALVAGSLVERSFQEMVVVGAGLLVTGALLLVSSRFGGDRSLEHVSVRDALAVGLLQSLALLPGISRSGSTIVAGLARGLSRETAARFSFLLSVPAVVGAAVYEMPNVRLVPAEAVPMYMAGFLTAFAAGILAIHSVLRLLAQKKFHLFGYYCLTLGGGVLVYIAHALP